MGMHIVTNFQIINEMKKSPFFRVSLGLVPTVEKNGSRSFNDKDKFSWFYNTRYKTTIYGQGNVGDIRFYTDHYIKDQLLAVYFGDNYEEFIFDLDLAMISSKGVDFYIGHIIKEVETRYEELIKNNELKKLEEKPKGNASKVIQNPGAVSYEDLKAYLEEQRRNRQL
jgi:hypothetical protein